MLVVTVTTVPVAHDIDKHTSGDEPHNVVASLMASLTCVNLPITRFSQLQHQCKCSLQSATGIPHPRQSVLVRSQSVYNRRPNQQNPQRVSCSAGNFEEGELIKGVKAGDKLKVKESRLVYHAPTHKVSIR